MSSAFRLGLPMYDGRNMSTINETVTFGTRKGGKRKGRRLCHNEDSFDFPIQAKHEMQSRQEK